MAREDTQYTADELELMNSGEKATQAAPAEETPPAEAAAEEQAAPAEAAAAPAEAPADAPAAEEPAASEPFIPQFDGTGPENYDEAKKALRAEKTDIRAKWSAGELSDEEYAQAEAGVEDKLEQLQAEYLTAQALTKANEQIKQQQARETLNSIAAAAKGQGIDYADEGLASLFDARMKAVAAEESFKGKPFGEIAAEAHRRVADLFGKTQASPAPTPAPTPAPAAAKAPAAPRPQIPPSLGNMPAAAAQPVANDLASQIAAIDDPDLAEAKLASLPPAQRNALLRSTMATTR